MKKKYVVLGDYIRSAYDGDRHFISANELCRLYGLNPKECYLSTAGNEGKRDRYLIPDDPTLIILRPRFTGDYREHLQRRIAGEES